MQFIQNLIPVSQPLQASYQKLVEHLYKSSFGGYWGEGWRRDIAPRRLFYTAVVVSAVEWILVAAIVAAVVSAYSQSGVAAVIVCWVGIVFYAVMVFDTLVVERGEHALEGWRGVLMFFSIFTDLLHMLPIATLVCSAYKQHQWTVLWKDNG